MCGITVGFPAANIKHSDIEGHLVLYKLTTVVSLALTLALVSGEARAAGSHTESGSQAAQKSVTSVETSDKNSNDFEFAYIDKAGKVVVTGPFAMATSFNHGVAVVSEKPYEWHDGHWTAPVDAYTGRCDAIIDKSGKKICTSRVISIEPFEGEYTVAEVREAPQKTHFALIDTQGKASPVVDCIQAANYSEGLFAIRNNAQALGQRRQDGFGYMDKAGRLAIPYRYAIAGPFSEGLAAVALEQRAGLLSIKQDQHPHAFTFSFIDKNGTTKIPGPFERTRAFKGGLAAVNIADKWGYIDKEGKQVVPCQYQWAGDFSGPLAPVEKDKMIGFIDKSGKVVIPFKFKNAESFGEGLAPATIDGVHWGFIDEKGAFKIEPSYRRTHPFSDGLALVYIKPRTDIGTRPEEAEYFYTTANQLREDGAINDSLRNCDTAIKLAPDSEWGKRALTMKTVAMPDHFIKDDLIQLLVRGTVSAENHDLDTAYKLFKDCLDQDPGFLQASGSLAYVLNSQQKYDEAIAVLDKTLKAYPSYARGYLRLAQAYDGLGKTPEAQTALDKARKLAPDDVLIQVANLNSDSR
jgi:tetratricopeptide (TPR) repeat protein